MISPNVEAWCVRSRQEQESRPGAGCSQLKKVTVVIPSYGRQEFLLRQLVYWGTESAQVVIVDGSPSPIGGTARAMFSASSTIRYFHEPGTIGHRLNFAARHIDTPYAVLLGDDEFLLTTGLSRAVDKLERNPGLVACIGQSLGFYPSSNGETVTYGSGYPHWRYEATQETARDRLLAAMANYNAATCYAVIREPCWSQSWGALSPWSSSHAAEMQQAIAIYSFGKVSSVDDVYWMRSYENPTVLAKGEPSHKLMFSEWWSSPRFAFERSRFIQVPADSLAATGQAGHPQAEQIILEAVDAYLALCRRVPAAPISIASRAASVLRSRFSQALRRALSEKQLLRLRAVVGMKYEGNLGRLEAIRNLRIGNAFHIGDELISELSGLEKLVTGFWRARLAGSSSA